MPYSRTLPTRGRSRVFICLKNTFSTVPVGAGVRRLHAGNSDLIKWMNKKIQHDLPLVSIIIPNYNHARYLGDAIHSVLNQAYRNFEIIVVDDGSTDDSRAVAEQFGDRVKYIYQANAGLSAARNTGIRHAQGSLIGVLDADDMYEAEYLRILIGSLQENPDADGIYCGYQFADEQRNLLPQIEARPVEPDKLYATLLEGNFFVPESILLRRAVYDRVGLFDELLRSCEDWDVWLRAAKKYRIIHTTQILTRHRVLPGSMSTNPSRMLTSRLAVLKKHVGDEPVSAGVSESHRAYGRAYLASCVEFLQAGNSDRAYECFHMMTNLCPVLLTEIDTFYQLGCGSQPKGSMGDLNSLPIRQNSITLFKMVERLFADSGGELKRFEHRAFSQSHLALALLAYGAGDFGYSRRHLFEAATRDPRQFLEADFQGLWLRSLLGANLINRFRSLRRRFI